MSKINFPASHTEKIATRYQPPANVYFEQIGTEVDHAQVICDLVRDLTAADFRGALQDPRQKERYATTETATQRIEELKNAMNNRRPIGAYLLNVEESAAYNAITPIGLCVFARERRARRLDLTENGHRSLAAWYRPDLAKQFDRLPLDNAVVRGAVAIAKKAQVHTLHTTIGKSSEEGRLVMPDAGLDLPKLFGFTDEGELSLEVEGQVYPGTRYAKTF